jgi:hypothetical protein
MQQPGTPFVVEVFEQPDVARDISVDTALGIFALAGAFLAVCFVVALLGASSFLLYRRLREARGDVREDRGTALDLSRPDDPTI